MRKTVIYTIIYLTISLLIILISSGILPLINFCEIRKLQLYEGVTLYRLLPILFIVVLGIIVSIGIKRDYRPVYHTIIPLLFFFIYTYMYNKQEEKYFNDNKTIITYGIVIKKMERHLSAHLKYSVRIQEKELNIIGKAKGKYFSKFNIGDTILVKYVEKCRFVMEIYDYTPSKKELEKCKNDCYLINGKLIPKKINEKKY